MKSGSVFEYQDFRSYLELRLAPHGQSRGMRSQLATMIRVRPSYVSMVLSGELQLNLDHIPEINKILGHSEDEAEYFLLLVLYTQAGSQDWKNDCKVKMESILAKRRESAEWIRNKADVSEADQAKFVSAWYYSVIHTLTGVPQFQSKPALASRLNLSMGLVGEVLDFLKNLGLVEEKSGRYKMTEKRLHLSKKSEWTANYHRNIRQMSVESLTEPDSQELHYSFVMSLSLSDKEKVQKKLMDVLKITEDLVQDSPSEEVMVLSVDYFRP